MFLLKLFSFSLLPVGLLAVPINLLSNTDFFPNTSGNLTQITWAHAVNNLTYLMTTLNDSSIMMIEADVVYGRLNGTGPNIPIMGHPPATTSDLSLQNFLEITYNFNQNAQNKSIKKGVKLDFKTIEVFENSLSVINRLYDKIDYPVWINADILPGPLNSTTIPVDADRFLSQSKNFTNSILSLGWTTFYGQSNNITAASYTNDQINSMTDVIRRNNVTQGITFAVRAGIAAQSPTQMHLLKQRFNNSTLTIWSSAGDRVDVDKLRRIIFDYGLNRVYIDVPKELKDQLNLQNSSDFIRSSPILLLIIAVFAYMW